MNSASDEVIQSPCIGVCAMNESSGFCHGCFRTIDEIRNWWDMKPDERLDVCEKLAERQIESASFD